MGYQEEIDNINQRLADMDYVQARMAEQGIGLGEYDLDSLASLRAKERIKEEEIAKTQEAANQQGIINLQGTSPQEPPVVSITSKPQEQAIVNIDDLKKGTAVIGGEIAAKDIKVKEDPLASKDYIEKRYSGGGIFRAGKAGQQLSDIYEKRGTAKKSLYTPAEIYARQNEKNEDLDLSYGEVFPYQQEMGEDFPQLKEYQSKYPFKKVRQVTYKSNLIDGKPVMTLEPVYDMEQVVIAAPKQSEFVGDINYLSKHRKALEKYFDKKGIPDWEKYLKKPEIAREVYDVK